MVLRANFQHLCSSMPSRQHSYRGGSLDLQVSATMLTCPDTDRIVEFAYYKEDTIVVVLEPVSSAQQAGKLHLIPTDGLSWCTHSSPVQLPNIIEVITPVSPASVTGRPLCTNAAIVPVPGLICNIGFVATAASHMPRHVSELPSLALSSQACKRRLQNHLAGSDNLDLQDGRSNAIEHSSCFLLLAARLLKSAAPI